MKREKIGGLGQGGQRLRGAGAAILTIESTDIKVQAMGAILIVVALAFCGCVQNAPPLPEKAPEAKAQVEKWVPVGTSLIDAQHTMEQHGFQCIVTNNGAWDTRRGVDYISCDFAEKSGISTLVLRRWQVALFMENEKVTSVDVKVGFTGP